MGEYLRRCKDIIDRVYPNRQWYRPNQPIKRLVLNGTMRRRSQRATPEQTQDVKTEPCQLAYRLSPAA